MLDRAEPTQRWSWWTWVAARTKPVGPKRVGGLGGCAGLAQRRLGGLDSGGAGLCQWACGGVSAGPPQCWAWLDIGCGGCWMWQKVLGGTGCTRGLVDGFVLTDIPKLL